MNNNNRSQSFRESVEILLSLSNLARRGLSQSVESNLLREAMNNISGDLSEEEQNIIDILSADLWFSIGEELGPMPSDEMVNKFSSAVKIENWTDVAAFLLNFPKLAVGREGALLRAKIWEDFGEKEVAEEFKAYAEKLLE